MPGGRMDMCWAGNPHAATLSSNAWSESPTKMMHTQLEAAKSDLNLLQSNAKAEQHHLQWHATGTAVVTHGPFVSAPYINHDALTQERRRCKEPSPCVLPALLLLQRDGVNAFPDQLVCSSPSPSLLLGQAAMAQALGHHLDNKSIIKSL